MTKKSKIVYQEKYNKGSVIDKHEVKRLLNENLDKIVIEIRERTIYSDDTEGIVIELRF